MLQLPPFNDWLTVDKKVCSTISDMTKKYDESGDVFKSVPHSVLTFSTPICSLPG